MTHQKTQFYWVQFYGLHLKVEENDKEQPAAKQNVLHVMMVASLIKELLPEASEEISEEELI